MKQPLLNTISVLALSAALQVHAGISLNPDVTPETISKTICVPGYTKTVRPSVSYTNGVKRKLMRARGIPASDARLWELDHLVALGSGGHPRSLDNLVLQKRDGPDGARVKDVFEAKMQKMICAHRIPLATVQNCMYTDWQACANRYASSK